MRGGLLCIRQGTGMGWHAARLFGLLFTFVFSITLLVTWSKNALPSLDDLATIKDSIGSLAHKSQHWNAYQLDPPPEQPPYGALVAATRSTEDSSWMTSFQQKYVSRRREDCPGSYRSVLR